MRFFYKIVILHKQEPLMDEQSENIRQKWNGGLKSRRNAETGVSRRRNGGMLYPGKDPPQLRFCLVIISSVGITLFGKIAAEFYALYH